MLETIAVATLFSAINFGVFNAMIWKYETFLAPKKDSVVDVIDCDDDKNCTHHLIK